MRQRAQSWGAKIPVRCSQIASRPIKLRVYPQRRTSVLRGSAASTGVWAPVHSYAFTRRYCGLHSDDGNTLNDEQERQGAPLIWSKTPAGASIHEVGRNKDNSRDGNAGRHGGGNDSHDGNDTAAGKRLLRMKCDGVRVLLRERSAEAPSFSQRR